MLIALAVFVAFAIAFVIAGRWMSVMIDHIHTTLIDRQSPREFLYDNGDLKFGPNVLSLMTIDYQRPAAITIADDRRVSVVHGKQVFPLGPGVSNVSKSGLPNFTFTPDPGDTVVVRQERSLLPWPVFEPNFMTGSSPLLKRHVYVHLAWKKASGRKLDVLWRAEQGYFPGESVPWRPERTDVMTNNLLSISMSSEDGNSALHK